MSQFRPTLAASVDDDSQLSKLSYPLIGSPKIDGIRVVCHPTYGPCTRSLKPLSNIHIRHRLIAPEYVGLDGEIVVGAYSGPNVFANTTGAVRSQSGKPDFTYWVFDYCNSDKPYRQRLYDVIEAHDGEDRDNVIALEHKYLSSPEGVLTYERECLARGFEGIMLRHPNSRYKHGRSTFKEQILLKVKRFKDDEATIIGFQPLERNNNPAERDALGLSKRTSHKAGRVEDSLLGNLIVSHPQFGEFGIGSGFDVTLRQEIWNKRDQYLGKQVTFKYQPIGTVDKPRFPIFLRFRPEE
jgi:DNA ligase 1